MLTLHQRTRMLPGLSCSSSIWTGGWEETEPWRDTRSLSRLSRESSSWAETLGTSTNAGTSGRLEKNTQERSERLKETDDFLFCRILRSSSARPVQLDVHGLLGETAQFVLLLPKSTT